MARKYQLPTQSAKDVASNVVAVASQERIDLNVVSRFCRKIAQSTLEFSEGVQITDNGFLILKSPFRENFVQSLLVYEYPFARFSAEETIAYTLPRHICWYLKSRRLDTVRERFVAEFNGPLMPAILRGNLQFWEGLVSEGGSFSVEPKKSGVPAIIAFQAVEGEPPSLALEIRGPAVANADATFRKTLLETALKEVIIATGLAKGGRGRPRIPGLPENLAHARDHRNLGKVAIAKEFCDCRQERHDRRCFDRLLKLADGFYASKRASVARELSKCQAKS